jgi:hypothetical protein
MPAEDDKKGDKRKLLTLFYLIYGVDVCHAILYDTANFFQTFERPHYGYRVSYKR